MTAQSATGRAVLMSAAVDPVCCELVGQAVAVLMRRSDNLEFMDAVSKLTQAAIKAAREQEAENAE